MVLKRFFSVLGVALAAQAGVFAFTYRDLLALRKDPTTLAHSRAAFAKVAESALARPMLTRRHLETLAQAAHESGDLAIELQALERLTVLSPAEPGLALRYGDALRRAGRHDDASHVFQRLIDRGYGGESR
jgi:hypothetical protein